MTLKKKLVKRNCLVTSILHSSNPFKNQNICLQTSCFQFIYYYNKARFSIKYPTRVDMPLNKITLPNITLFCYKGIYQCTSCQSPCFHLPCQNFIYPQRSIWTSLKSPAVLSLKKKIGWDILIYR